MGKLLALALGLFSVQGTTAQYVQVPSGCVVVVPGTGGSIALNRVGDGGIVTMPDPSGMGNSFTLAGATPIKWTLLGDLSMDAVITPPTAPVTTAGAVTAVKIMSYNKTLRPSEGNTPSTNARSKGRVTIEYTISPCNNKMSFDIFKVWGNPATTSYGTRYAPPIVGPDCWGQPPYIYPSNLITFSVDQVSSDNATDDIGFDRYYWDIWNGQGQNLIMAYPNLAYNSADASSVTIKQGDLNWNLWLDGGPYKMRVCYGRANPWDGGFNPNLHQATSGFTCVSKSIGSAPAQPALTVNPSCPAWNLNTFTASVNSVGYACSWISDNPLWTLAPSGANNQTVTVTNAGPNPGKLILTMQGTCGQYVFEYPIQRSLAGITPIASATCVAAGGTFTVSLPGNAQNNCTNWTITPTPSPAWGYSQNTTGSVRTYTIPAGTCAAQYAISATGCGCAGTSAAVVVNVQPATPTITGPACVPYNAGAPAQTYTASTACGTTGYAWSNTLGMTGSSTTASIGYTPAGTTGGQVRVVANGTDGCNSTMAVLNVNRTPPMPSVSWPCVNVGLPGTTVFAVNSPAPGVNYTWSFPAGLGTFAGGAATSKTVNTLGNPGTYNCSVSANNAASPFCGPVTYNFQVVVGFSTAVSAVNQAGSSTVVATPGQSSYQLWNCSIPAAQGAPQAGNTFNLSSTGPGSYSVNITTLAGCVERPACVLTNFSFMAPGGGGPEPADSNGPTDAKKGFVIHPNPNGGSFTISLLRKVETGLMTIYDAQGKQVGDPIPLMLGDNPVHQEALTPGTYYLQLDLDGALEIRCMVVAGH
ncbi:MAG: hypothetical protein JST98_02475 [Bacteroidetes bacterium]|nr:hypothetical protein [Bacteroidota bacterium]